MHWRLSLRAFWCGISIPGAVLMAGISPSYAIDPCIDVTCNISTSSPSSESGEPLGTWDETASNLSTNSQKPDRAGLREKKRGEVVATAQNLSEFSNNLPLGSGTWYQPIATGPRATAPIANSPAEAQGDRFLMSSDGKNPVSLNQNNEIQAIGLKEARFLAAPDDLEERLNISFSVSESGDKESQGDRNLLQSLIAQTPQNPPAPPVNPQPDPNRDRFPQPVPEPQPPTPSQQEPVLPTPTTPQPTPIPPQPTPPSPSEPKIAVQKIEVTGSTLFKPEQLNAITAPVEGTSVTLEELRKVADSITQLYLDKGYITSRAVLASQQIEGGVVKIIVIEGSLERIEVEGAKRINPNYIRSRLLLGAGVPLSTAALENQLRLLRIDPLFENIEASLRASDKVGQSILTVRVTEANPLVTNFSIDNYSPPSVGSERVGAFGLYRNVTGIGDEISLSYYKAIGESNVYDLSYRVPINAMNGTIQFRVAPNNNEIVQQPFKDLGISGESELYEVSYRQPLVRSPQEEFALSLGFSHQRGQTFTAEGPAPFGFGPDEDTGITRTSVFKFGQDYLRRDVSGAWVLRSQFSFGTGLLDATTNEDPIPDSRFISWTGQAQRVQRLNNDNLLIVQADLQLTPDSLLPSQQFVIGGGLSLRGYRQNARSGDVGFRFSVEDRYTVQRDSSGLPILQFAPFIDLGAVRNVGGNPNTLPEDKFLAGVGLGVLWEVLPGLNVRVDYGIPLVELSDKGNNAQDSGFYFSVNYSP